MHLPELKFDDYPPRMEVGRLHNFLFKSKWGWQDFIFQYHPELKEACQELAADTEDNQFNFLARCVAEFKESHKSEIKTNQLKYEEEWRKVEEDFFATLSGVIGIEWPLDREIITAMISINPITPRSLEDWNFAYFYNYHEIADFLETVMHECCHFLYFEKWKELFPEIESKNFDAPYIEWHLSEVIAPIILNDERIQKILKKPAHFYPQHYQNKIGERSIVDFFTELYHQQNNFSDFLKKSYELIRLNEDKFKF